MMTEAIWIMMIWNVTEAWNDEYSQVSIVILAIINSRKEMYILINRHLLISFWDMKISTIIYEFLCDDLHCNFANYHNIWKYYEYLKTFIWNFTLLMIVAKNGNFTLKNWKCSKFLETLFNLIIIYQRIKLFFMTFSIITKLIKISSKKLP